MVRGWRKRSVPIALFAVAMTWLSGSGSVNAQNARMDLQDCRLESPNAGGSVAARCGWLTVPEDRDNPAGRKVRLHVAVIPAMRLQPAPDPLFILSGGPGQAASDYYTALSGAFGRIRRDRDIVLVDQRGTGRSNRLDCAFDDEADFSGAEQEQLQKQASACIKAMPGDPRFYTTSVAVRDLDEVRGALGYQTLNFYSVSYGTRVAQHFMRRYPDRVRTAILDGVVPVDLALGPDISLQAQRALDVLFERCAADKACNTAFPALRNSFQALRERLQATPLKMQIPDPVTAAMTDASFGVPELSAAVRMLSYSDETASVLPLLIHQAEADRQPQGMLAQYLMIRNSMETQIANGMHFAVTCSEDSQRWAEQPADPAALKSAYLGDALISAMSTICSVWPRGPVDKDFNAPLHSDVPTLLLSGGNDPVTPAAYGERAAKGFTHGRHLVLPGQGHGQLAVSCMPRLVARFIDQRALEDADLKCLDNVAPTPFMLSATATGP